MAKVYRTPGVYIEEQSAFPNSAVPVPTAVPAFVGYTEKAIHDRKDLTNVPTRIASFGEYLHLFGGAPRTTYDLSVDGLSYELKASARRFFLFHSIRLFFANGGSDCYIVSIGDYSSEVSLGDFAGERVEDGQLVQLGINTLVKEPEPTMLVIPDAVLLGQADCYSLQQDMLRHCGYETRSRIAILDIHDGFRKRSGDAEDVIEKFRTGIGGNFLDFGAAYYPWLCSMVVSAEEVDFTNIEGGSLAAFQGLLKADINQRVKKGELEQTKADLILSDIDKLSTLGADSEATEEDNKDVKDVHQQLLATSVCYRDVMHKIREHMNLLPPSGCMAGIYSMVDDSIGVWQSPANVSVGSVTKPAVSLTNEEQEDLNLPLSGKAVNAIRTFPGRGVLVWGARTLNGNSQDWRYISVRRTVIFIEQSIKYAAEPYVFEPNTAATWTNVKALITNFLTNVWQSGGLAGASPGDAFQVEVGLGVTMTPVDILDGIMRIMVKIAITHPAEFIIITFQQKMQQS
ncbi:MAG: phage tail sheath family protein [Lewinella sp.]|nr:phage tail sheath family protein [Lewinella sp.]